ncbi:PAS domain-containing sensor histidine kinase [Chitinolyticbacter albus]|uniref:PAS domain-containing sensor histidine kinase n=1 Tax=Chitinolyticbacter albus TaxID=2961951 RepID=UPI00210E86E7|nr:PAS domain-containing protein [Chitinolyticbacter albus]
MDYRALFRLSPSPLMVMDAGYVIREVNAAYLAVTGRERATLVGRHVFDAFPLADDALEDAPLHQLQLSFERVFATGATDILPLLHYPVPRLGEGGEAIGFDDRYWSCTHVPLHDDEGRVYALLQQTEDVTALQRLRQQLDGDGGPQMQDEQTRVSCTVWRRAEQVQQLNALLDAESQHLRRLFAQAPGFLAVLRGEEQVIELVNDALMELVGPRTLLGRPFCAALPEVAERGFGDLLARVLRTSEPYVGRALSAELQREPGVPPSKVVVNLVCQPVIEADGHVSGIFIVGQDITVQHRAEAELLRYQERLEALVGERTAKLSELAGYLQRISEDERSRLARELHDELGSLLTAIKLDLSWVRRQLPEKGALHDKLMRTMSVLDEGILLKRRLIEDLRPSALLHLGLYEALQLLLDEHATRQQWRCVLDVEPDLPRLNDEAALALYRIAQEALHNASKHAKASTVTVALRSRDEWLEMSIKDNGRGCEPDDVRARPVGHHGLIGMEQRALAFGGELSLRSRSGHGCTVLARVPLARVARPSMPDED